MSTRPHSNADPTPIAGLLADLLADFLTITGDGGAFGGGLGMILATADALIF